MSMSGLSTCVGPEVLTILAPVPSVPSCLSLEGTVSFTESGVPSLTVTSSSKTESLYISPIASLPAPPD